MNLKAKFPGGSKEFFRKNPPEMPVEQRGTAVELCRTKKTVDPSKDGPQPNKTELRFQAYFHRQYSGTRTLEFQPLTLRIGRRRYTPDWVYFGITIRLFEIKGPYIYDDAKLKYDLFKTHYSDRFQFEMWTEVNGIWTLIR